MMRTQIQLPDALYARAKQIAKQHEMSLAEVVRRGLEHMARIYPVVEQPDAEWSLPEALELGEFQAPEDAWRELANAGEASRE